MAHVAHFKASDIKRLQNEYDRDEKYKCRDGRIDSLKTKNNYNMESDSLSNRFKKRFAEVQHSNRKDLNVLSDWVITCPQELQNDSDRTKFFQLSYEFVKARYEANNVLQGYVHNDETSPHMHIPVIPVKDNRVSAKALFTRAELHSFHKDLDKVMQDEFGVKGLILNGRTKGNYTVTELKERTKQEQALSEREEQANIEDYAQAQRQESLDSRESDLKAREDDLERQTKDFALYKQEWLKTANKKLETANKELEDLKNQLNEDFQKREDALEAQFRVRVDKAAQRRIDAAQRLEQFQEQSQSRIRRRLPGEPEF